MNAPVPVMEVAAVGDLEDFSECCEVHSWFCERGWISLRTAADNLQHLAENWALVDEFGQDHIQELIAAPFARLRAAAADEEYNDVRRIMARWEAADTSRSEPPRRPAPYSPAESTVTAFKYLTAVGDIGRIREWLADRPKDAPHLLALLESPAC